MHKRITLLIALLLTSCVSIAVETEPPAEQAFVTSTLPPTRDVPPTITGTPAPAVTLTPTILVTKPANCTDSAVLLEDVTIPDGTRASPSQKFTKTWRFINNGTCPWINYTLVFAAGDQMGAPLSAPIPQTEPKAKVDVSVELTAPSSDGAYTAYFTLHTAEGKSIPIGIEKTFWVKIVVGNAAGTAIPQASSAAPTQSGSTTGRVSGTGDCNYSQNAGYISQIESSINAERANAGLAALTVNASLASAAQGHSADMACNNMVSHTGSDGSSAHTRIAAAGYTPSYSEEIIYAGGGPQVAMTWWMNDKIHRDAILNPDVTEIGIGHANSSNGDYFTVDFASP
ncbi:MAG TPA: NBR1-Ig-like domain-containing protein [Anaerolineales bacterium]